VNGNQTPRGEAIQAVAAWRRADFIRDLTDLIVYYTINLNVPVPDRGVFTLGDGPDERAYDVLATAVALDVTAVPVEGGCLRAARQIGTLTIETRTPPRKATAA
jgi:hypothetical protein